MDNAMTEKNHISKRNQVPDIMAVKAMEEKNQEQVNAAEKQQKNAVMSSDRATEQSLSAEQHVQEKSIKLDKANAKAKKSGDILAAMKRSKEGATKAHTLAKDELAFKTTKN